MNDIVTDPTPTALFRLNHRCWDTCQDPGDPYGRSPEHRCWDIIAYTVTKVTATRVYFRDAYDRHYFLQRAAFDNEEGAAYHRRIRDRLYLTPPEIPGRAKPVSISDLRRQMADAHPDRGGDRDTFMSACARYIAAKRRCAADG